MGQGMGFTIDEGWINPARRVASPNFGPRPDPQDISLLVIHNISLPPGQFDGDCIEALFCNRLDWDAHPYFQEIRGLEVSSHLLIRRSGELLQFVSFEERAWHAGRSEFCGRNECNDFSIGIELEGTDDLAYEEKQYQVLAQVTGALLDAYPGLSQRDIVGHNEIAPGRKTDPGPAFDWRYYRSLLG